MSERAKSTKSLQVTHDTFFVETFQMHRFAKAFLKVVLPAKTVKQLDLDGLTVIPRHLSNSLFKGKIADVIYRVPIRKSKQHIDDLPSRRMASPSNGPLCVAALVLCKA